MTRPIDWIDIAKAVIVLVLAPFIALNVWAYLPYPHIQSVGRFFAIPFVELGEVMGTHRFVSVIGADLMFGWALTSILVAVFERSMGRSWFRVALWILPLNFVGNAVWAIYLLLYLRPMCSRLGRA